jgi:hypothetical protein
MANNEYLNKNFLDSYGTKWLFDILTPNSGSLVFKAINDDLIEINNKIKINPAWNNGEEILSSLYTSSQSEQNYKDYSLNVYSNNICGQSSKQFTIEYGHKDGYGTTYDYVTEKTETKAVYKKYEKILIDSGTFNYSQIYAIKFNKKEVQDEIYAEFFTIKISNPATQSLYSTIINYDYFASQSAYENTSQKVIRLVSGSLESGIYYENGNPLFFGELYINNSVVILNPDTLNNRVGLNIQDSPDTNEKNAEKLYLAISSSIYNMNSNNYNYWAIVNTKNVNPVMTFPITIPTTYFNYSTNPSFYDDFGKIKTKQFLNDPTSYFTTIGLYNNKYELLAIAKLSTPFKKTFIEQYVFDINIEIK